MNQSAKSLLVHLLGLLFCSPFLPALGAQSAGDAITPAEALVIAKEATIYGFPLVENYRVMHSYFVDVEGKEFKAPWNQIHNETRVFTPDDQTIQTPNWGVERGGSLPETGGGRPGTGHATGGHATGDTPQRGPRLTDALPWLPSPSVRRGRRAGNAGAWQTTR